MNKLYYGDNLDVMRRHIADESVDLVYLDPPFNSGRDYNAIFKGKGSSKAQVKAFTDTWTWDAMAVNALDAILNEGGKLAHAMQAFQALLGDSSTLAYLSMMAPRLQEIRRVLKPTGSVYLHCDPTASHYLKILMDAVFGQKNFRNEIVWCYSGGGVPRKDFPRKHDVILRYTTGNSYTFNVERKAYKANTQAVGKHSSFAAPDKQAINLDRGTPVTDWWTDLPTVTGWAKERLGYPTQKPIALLDRIIKASTNPGDVVLDPFCGCGTAIDSAQGLDRRWIGIDITHLAVGVMKGRLNDRYGDDCKFDVIGEPVDLAGARQLAKEDTHQFEHWALGLVGARASAKKKGGDKGIDGVLLLNSGRKIPLAVPISIKSGNVNPGMIRDLRGVMARDKSPLAIIITLKEPSKGMKAEAAKAGDYKDDNALAAMFGGDPVPRLQILTIQDLLAGQKPQLPWARSNTTRTKALRGLKS